MGTTDGLAKILRGLSKDEKNVGLTHVRNWIGNDRLVLTPAMTFFNSL